MPEANGHRQTPPLVPADGLTVRRVRLDDLHQDPANVRQHGQRNLESIRASLQEFGQVEPLVVQRGTNKVIGGNGRLEAMRAIGFTECDIVEVDADLITATALSIALNRTAELAGWDDAGLADQLRALQSEDFDLGAVGYTDGEIDALIAGLGDDILGGSGEGNPATSPPPSLAERFGVPPFSVLDARQGYWQDRKRQWLALGIESELGRGDSPGTSASARPGEEPTYRQIGSGNGLLGESEQARSHYRNASPGGSPRPAATLGPDGRTVRGDGKGRSLARTFGSGGPGTMDEQRRVWRREDRLTWVAGDQPVDDLDETSRKNLAAQPQSGTSIFDPVLCELAYRWFCPEGGAILDPFAGGSVRGVVASVLGRPYTGIDLRPEQVAANEEQAGRITPDRRPRWLVGDSRDVATLASGVYDLIFSCPPYADLERYSDDPRDLSTMDYSAFLAAYRAIVAASVALLAPDRFACFVVGDVRDPRGFYRNFVADTIAAFQDAGATLYNEAILVTAVGSLPIRVGRQFGAYRKLGKTHQNVLVFYNGNPKRIPDVLGEIAAPDLAAEFGEVMEPGDA